MIQKKNNAASCGKFQQFKYKHSRKSLSKLMLLMLEFTRHLIGSESSVFLPKLLDIAYNNMTIFQVIVIASTQSGFLDKSASTSECLFILTHLLVQTRREKENQRQCKTEDLHSKWIISHHYALFSIKSSIRSKYRHNSLDFLSISIHTSSTPLNLHLILEAYILTEKPNTILSKDKFYL